MQEKKIKRVILAWFGYPQGDWDRFLVALSRAEEQLDPVRAQALRVIKEFKL